MVLPLFSVGTYKANASTAAPVIVIWNSFDALPFWFSIVRKAFLSCLRGKELRLSYDLLAEENQNWCKNFYKIAKVVSP